jgi:hypothetical protein
VLADGALTAVDEDQHAGIAVAEVAGALELQLLATMEGHLGALAAALFGVGEHDRGDQAEGDGVIHALRWGVERLGDLALIEVVNEPAGEAAAGVVSADGKTLKATNFGYDTQLRQFEQRTVWDRQQAEAAIETESRTTLEEA